MKCEIIKISVPNHDDIYRLTMFGLYGKTITNFSSLELAKKYMILQESRKYTYTLVEEFNF